MNTNKKNTTPARNTCRISGEPLTKLFSLGEIYLSDFLPINEEPEFNKVPLTLCLAPKSGLIQLEHTVAPDQMYRRYWYKSGTNLTMTRELESIVTLTQKLMLWEKGDVWIDIGCNDGTLLKFISPDFTTIGFDPNDYSSESGKFADLIVNNYFTANDYEKTPYSNKKAKIITSIAMFYDLEDPHTFVQDVYDVLDDNGLWIIQMSYLPLMLKQLAFDNICHEHIEYYNLTTLKLLLDDHDFNIVDCEFNDVNGGSFRIFVRKNIANSTTFATAPYRDVAQFRVDSILAYEKTLALDVPETYEKFFKEISELRSKTISFIREQKQLGKKIWGYGASTKGNTLLQWFGLDHTLIDGIAERSPAKYGLKTVGTNIPIYSEAEMRAAEPDFLLVLPWHFISEFIEREKEFLDRGGKFIVPCPQFEIIESSSK